MGRVTFFRFCNRRLNLEDQRQGILFDHSFEYAVGHGLYIDFA